MLKNQQVKSFNYLTNLIVRKNRSFVKPNLFFINFDKDIQFS